MASTSRGAFKLINAVKAAAALSVAAETFGLNRACAVARALTRASAHSGASQGGGARLALTVIIGCWEAAEGKLDVALEAVRSRALPESVLFTGGDAFTADDEVGINVARPGPVVAEAALAALKEPGRCFTHVVFQHTDHLHERSLYPSETLYFFPHSDVSADGMLCWFGEALL